MPPPALRLLRAIAALALAGCLGAPADGAALHDHDAPHASPGHHDGDDASRAPAPDPGPADRVVDAHAGAPDDEMALRPDPLTVSLNQVVEIRVVNGGRAPHTFTIHDFGADTGVLQPGERGVVKFRADRAGQFLIMCDVAGHYEAGMKATLHVVA